MRYVFGDWSLDPQLYTLHRAGHTLRLRPKVFAVLIYLLIHHERVVSRQELATQIWPAQYISDAALESAIRATRQALGDSGRTQQYIQTLHGHGYRFIVPVEIQPGAGTDVEGTPPAPPMPVTPQRLGDAAPASPLLPVQSAPLLVPRPALGTASGRDIGQRLAEAERRQLTVLVCALVAAPPLARSLDPDDLYAVIRTYQETCAPIIRHFDGYIAQYRGEEIVVYFGYPQAHDEDPQRAVHTGLRLVEALGQWPPRLAHAHGSHWAVRVGVHTGMVVVGPLGDGGLHDRWALGDTPTLAAQLHKYAAPNTVVISEATRRLIDGYFICHPLGAQPGHGMATSPQAYRVVRESAAQHRLDVVSASSLTPFVSREHEVGLLVACWKQATEGLGRVAVINGEAGIGKSRLVRVLQEHLTADPHTEILWRGSPYDQQSALHPVMRHLQHLVQVRPEEAPAAALQRLEEVLTSSGLALTEVVPLFAALLALPLPARYPPLLLTPQRQRQQTLDALLVWLLAEATRHPVLCIVEDVHWVDPTTLELLSLLIDQAPTARLLLVLTCRPEFHPPWGFRAHLTPITLGCLSPSQAESMIRRVAGQALPPAVRQRLAAHTDGVPLFIEEVTKLVLESLRLQAHAEHDALPGSFPALAIPATLHDTLMARLDRLASSKAVAQLGAVIGRTFPYTVLQAVSPWEETALQHGLRQLIKAELVYQQGVPPQASYRFKHALIQETAYQSLLKSTRQQYHQQIAQVLTQHFPEIVDIQPELLAQHYTEAGCHAQAIPHWQRAGQQAMARASYVEAARLLSKSAALVEALPDTPARARQELALQMARGRALQFTKGYAAPEVEAAYHRARELAQHGQEPRHLLPVLEGLVSFYLLRGALRTARELGEHMLRLAQRVHDPVWLGNSHIMLGNVLFACGALDAARMHLEQGLACSTLQQPHPQSLPAPSRLQVFGLSRLALILWHLGYPNQALQRSQTALALAHTLAHPVILVAALIYAAHLHQRRQEAHRTGEYAEAALVLAHEQGFALRWAEAAMLRGWARVAQGQGAAGITQLRQGLAAYRATGAEITVGYLVLLAEALRQRGQSEEGLRVIGEALALGDSRGEGQWAAEVSRCKGELLLTCAAAHQAEAETCFQHALAMARRQQAMSWELRAAMSLSRLWQSQGKQREAQQLLVGVYGWFTEGFDTADLQEARALLDALAG